MFNGVFKDKKILITGHTGFKGSWLSLWLKNMGAFVIGYSLKPPTTPNHFDILKLDKEIISITGDIRDKEKLENTFKKYRPEVVFHMAAQPIVRDSYTNPFETYEINVMGTLNVLQACRTTDSVKSVLLITTDKCYENKEWVYGYREVDALGGYDPYSSSKACAEILINSFRKSFFNLNDYGQKHTTLISSVRAGNVIGGGDWGNDRLIPDIIRAITNKEELIVRNPKAVRPWQHVLEPLSGYLMLSQKLLEGDVSKAEAWNFGPQESNHVEVEELVKLTKKYWSAFDYSFNTNNTKDNPHESQFLRLDCSKAYNLLGWKPVWNFEKSLLKTIEWYRNYYEKIIASTCEDILEYIKDAENKNLNWVS
ncbi:MAG: CDP-glucose 4,6-dehydratase [Candidatus Parvarchaeum sp.]